MSMFSKMVAALRAANYRRLARRKEPAQIEYRAWIAEHEAMTQDRRETFDAIYRGMTERPLISLIMPIYNAPIHWLKEAIESVQSQIYQEWQLCMADDCSTDPAVRLLLDGYARKDPRIRVTYRETNGHISAASNSAIDIATGSFLALMDQDDLIPAHALLRVAQAIHSCPDAGIIFTDEDKVNDWGLRESPTRKQGWVRERLFQYNCISHLGVYEAGLVRRVGGFRKGYEGSQDHDLAMRCAQQLTDEQIVHIPEILYHWRTHPNSTAYTRHAKPYASSTRNKLIAEHRKN